MAKTLRYTIAHSDGTNAVDLFKVILGADGSYMLTAPYHPHEKALLGIVTVNYAHEHFKLHLDDAQELALLDDDDRRLKISHHMSGFLQFSGEGVLSGRDEDGKPKGIGVQSYSLLMPTLGPSFGLMFSDPFALGRPSKGGKDTVTLHEREIEHMRGEGVIGLRIAGYYFPGRWLEFVHRGADGQWWMNFIHPQAQAVKKVRVLLASKEGGFRGFVGIEARPHTLRTDSDVPAFTMSTATGNLRTNAAGEKIAEMLFCMYPRLTEELYVSSLAYPLPDLYDDDVPAAAKSGALRSLIDRVQYVVGAAHRAWKRSSPT